MTPARPLAEAKPDGRFYEIMAPATVGELAALTGAALGEASRAARLVRRVADLRGAMPDDVVFCADRRHAVELAATRAGAVFVAREQAAGSPTSCAVLVCVSPQAAWAAAADRLHRPRRHDPTAPAIHPSARLEDGVVVGPGVVIGAGAAIGAGTVLSAGAVIGPGVMIGRDCAIGPNAVIGFALIGDRVRIYAGAAIGEAGFGAAAGPRGLVDVAQLGRVIIQDGVTIGAGSCVDRGALSDTTVGENTKIDNLVHIAHNVTVGRNCVMAAYTGISGSVTIGDNCQFGGRAGVSDHVTIGAGARIAAASGVMKNVPAGETWGGSPARPLRRWMREAALIGRLAERHWKGREEA